MTARFANVDLTMEDADGRLAKWIESHLSLSDLRAIAAEPIYAEASRPQWLPVPNYHRSPGVHINSLYWPTGASRWSVGHFLATTVQKNTIVNNLDWGVGSQSGVQPLDHFNRELSGWLEFGEPPIDTHDDRGNQLSQKFSGQKICVKMFMLPPIPLTVRGMANPKFRSKLHPDRGSSPFKQVAGDAGDRPLIGSGLNPSVTGIPENTGEGIWLVPLVDARWYWQMMSVGGIWAEQLTTGAQAQNQWNQTIKSIADTLGVNIFHSSIEDVYGEIDEDFAKRTSFHNAAYILDGIAYSTDRRLVHNWSDMGRKRKPLSEYEQGGGGATSNWESREFQLLTHDESLTLARENYEREQSTISTRVPLGTDVFGNQLIPRDQFDNPYWAKQIMAGDDFSNTALDYNGAVVPQFVTVVFRKCVANRSADPPETYSKRYEYNSTDVDGLTDLLDIQSNKPSYVYWGTEKVIRVAAWAKFDSGNSTTPSNNTELEALAKKLTLEHYKSLRLFHNYSLGSVEFWAETGYDDSVIYNFGRQRDNREESGLLSKEYVASTRVQSREFNHGVDELFNQLADCSLDGSTDPVVDQACCGGCAPSGSVGVCSHCDEANGAPASYTFQLWDQPTANRGTTPDGCCNQLAFPQFLYHSGGADGSGEECTWNGLELDQCDDSDPPSAPYPKWVLQVNGVDPFDNSLSISLPGLGLNGGDAVITYKNKYPWCCNCQNEMILICPTDLPVECTDIPCNVCIGPGVACCPTAPGNLTATITGNAGGVPSANQCGCAHGETVALVWDAANKKWIGQKVLCAVDGGQGHTIYLELVCTAEDLTAGIGGCADYRLYVEWLDNCAAAGTYSPIITGSKACSCDPFELCFETIDASNCCNNTISSSSTIGICIT